MSSVAQRVMVAGAVRVPGSARVAGGRRAAGTAPMVRVEATSGAAALLAIGLGALLLWSASYLVRQAGLGAASPAATMRVAVEGMALALVWLGALVSGCLAALSGAVTFREPGQ